jgi:hypothetical protein
MISDCHIALIVEDRARLRKTPSSIAGRDRAMYCQVLAGDRGRLLRKTNLGRSFYRDLEGSLQSGLVYDTSRAVLRKATSLFKGLQS